MKKLPLEHFIKNTEGWKIKNEILVKKLYIYWKSSFGSFDLIEKISIMNPDKITVYCLCIDICVISNALLLRTKLPNTIIEVIRSACAGTTVEK